MPEHQKMQQSGKPDSTFQKQAALTSQNSVSHPASIIQRARINPKSLTAADVLQLQRTIGNRAVGRLLSEIKNPSKVQQVPVQRQEPEEEYLQGKFESNPENEICPSCMQRKEIPVEEEPIQEKQSAQNQATTGSHVSKQQFSTQKIENNTELPDNLNSQNEYPSDIVAEASKISLPEPHPWMDVYGTPKNEDTRRRWAGGLTELNVLLDSVEQGIDNETFHAELKRIGSTWGFTSLHGIIEVDETKEDSDSKIELTAELNPKGKVKEKFSSRTRAEAKAIDTNRVRPAQRLNESLDQLREGEYTLYVDESGDTPKYTSDNNEQHLISLEAIEIPKVDSRSEKIAVSEGLFSSGDYHYLIEVIQNKNLWKERPTRVLVPLGSKFRIIKQMPVGGKSAKGRSFRGPQFVWRTPTAVAMAGTPTQQQFIKDIEEELQADNIDVVADQATAKNRIENIVGVGKSRVLMESQGLYGICIPNAGNRHDTQQSTQQDDALNVITSAAMDMAIAVNQRHVTANVYHTRVPASPRGSNRDPQRVAGGVSAAVVMGNVGAGQGQLGSHEYCHLVGDGDNGACTENNLVVGTNANNTEQLALETSLRRFRPQLRALGWSVDLDVTVLARAPPAVLPAGIAPWVSQHIGQSTRYRIYTRPKKPLLNPGGVINERVHEQMMDTQRGTIPVTEVVVLQHNVMAKMRERVDEIKRVYQTNNITESQIKGTWLNIPPQYLTS